MKRKRLLVMAVVAMLSVGMWSCGKDDNTNESDAGTTQVDPGIDPGTDPGTYPGAVWVDLGLPSGLLWAAHNVGASAPEDYGDRFAWGEVAAKFTYNWSTYRYCNGDYDQLTKYCNKSSYGSGYNGFTDDLSTLEPADDAATAAWGDGARTPTKEEWQELMDNTTSEWTTLGGVIGRRFTAANGSSIFLPAAGYRWDDELYYASYGYYWSSSLYTDNPNFAWSFYLCSDYQSVHYNCRNNGLIVRPVRSSLR